MGSDRFQPWISKHMQVLHSNAASTVSADWTDHNFCSNDSALVLHTFLAIFGRAYVARNWGFFGCSLIILDKINCGKSDGIDIGPSRPSEMFGLYNSSYGLRWVGIYLRTAKAISRQQLGRLASLVFQGPAAATLSGRIPTNTHWAPGPSARTLLRWWRYPSTPGTFGGSSGRCSTPKVQRQGEAVPNGHVVTRVFFVGSRNSWKWAFRQRDERRKFNTFWPTEMLKFTENGGK